MRECETCEGCGKIADDDDGTPWKHWLELPLQSSVAVLLGVVKPVTCPDCGGTGQEKPIWRKVSAHSPEPFQKCVVYRPALGSFVATPCYGMHSPSWVPLIADVYAPGAIVVPMEGSDQWIAWEKGQDIPTREEDGNAH